MLKKGNTGKWYDVIKYSYIYYGKMMCFSYTIAHE